MKITNNLASTQSVGTHNAASQRTQAVQTQSVSPAYQVDISPAGEKAQLRERMVNMYEQWKKQGRENSPKITTEHEKGLEAFLAKAAEKSAGNLPVSDEYADVLIDCDDNTDELFLGETSLWADIVGERELEATGLVNPLHEKSQLVMDKYFQAASAIEQGGVSTFRKLNLEFASVAYVANLQDRDYLANKDIAKGRYTREEYAQAQSFAAKLQNKAGVFVQASSGDGPFSYSYNGTIASVGVKCLNIMAGHEEAEAIWLKAVQGKYQNNEEVTAALQAGGFNEAAEDYTSFLRSHTTRRLTMDDIMQAKFGQGDSTIWNAAVGREKYAAFQAQYGGNGHFTYTAKQISQAYLNGQQEAEIIHKATSDREPSDFYVTEDGRVIKRNAPQKESNEAENKKSSSAEAQINALQEKIKRIRQQLSALHKNPNLSPEEQTRQTENYQKQIETFQRQIMDIKIQEMERQKHG